MNEFTKVAAGAQPHKMQLWIYFKCMFIATGRVYPYTIYKTYCLVRGHCQHFMKRLAASGKHVVHILYDGALFTHNGVRSLLYHSWVLCFSFSLFIGGVLTPYPLPPSPSPRSVTQNPPLNYLEWEVVFWCINRLCELCVYIAQNTTSITVGYTITRNHSDTILSRSKLIL